ncbi:MAG: energy transducer TonB [Blastocatellia bacterium]
MKRIRKSKMANDAPKRSDAAALLFRALPVLLALLVYTERAEAQLLRKSEYGVGMTVAVYQYDDTRSKELAQINTLKVTTNSPEEEIEYLTKNFGLDGLKFRYVRSVGLRESEPFTDTQPVNERPFTYTLTPRIVTKSDVTFDLIVKYGEQTLLDVKSVSSASYETVLLRGGRGEFGVKEFTGPNGPETAPDKRALLVTVTPIIQTARSLANKPSDISRPTDQFGSRVELGESDIFTMPAVALRAPLRFPEGSSPRGSITLEGIVTPEGRVTNIRVLDSPDSALNPKAIETFRQYRFNPAKVNGRPAYATYRETILLGKQGPL